MKKGSCCLTLVFLIIVAAAGVFILDVHTASQKRIEVLKKEVTTAVLSTSLSLSPPAAAPHLHLLASTCPSPTPPTPQNATRRLTRCKWFLPPSKTCVFAF